ncbi:MAG: cell division protein FtsL [Deltaproteobacteria bacterium]|nr:cell division protein FtsL [Deltaproteobacteria bacterium]
MSVSYPSIRKGNAKRAVSFWAGGYRLFLALSFLIMLIAFTMVLVSINHQSVQTGYDITRLNKEQIRLMDLNAKLKVEFANLTALDRLDRLARDSLGLAAPRPDQVTVIK